MIIDISQKVFQSKIYPGDPSPKRNIISSIDTGDGCNLTEFSMCAHNGTHVDAPFHYVNNGQRIDEIDLKHFVGTCIVVSIDSDVTASDAEIILSRCEKVSKHKRILIKGKCTVSPEAARVFADRGVLILGTENQSFGNEKNSSDIHKILLSKNVVLLEGLVLKSVPDGIYFLSAAPLNLDGADGAPCRAFLIDNKK